MLDLSDWKYAEPIYHFMQYPENTKHYYKVRETENISLSEYVQKYKLVEFSLWYEERKHLFECD